VAEHARGFGNLIGNLKPYSRGYKKLRNAFQVAKVLRLPTGTVPHSNVSQSPDRFRAPGR